MQSLWDSTPMAFVAVHLVPAPSHGDTAWMSKMSSLQSMGWGLLPVYVGQQAAGGPGSHALTSAQGSADATDAAQLAHTGSLSLGSVVYLDVEVGGVLPAAFVDYVAAWMGGMTSTDYRPGVYRSHFKTATQITGAVGDIPGWAYNPIDSGPSTVDLGTETARDPAESGYGAAIAWQYRMSLKGAVDLRWTDTSTGAGRSLHQVDLDTAVCTDPSNPVFPTPGLATVTPDQVSPGDTGSLEGSDFDGVSDMAFDVVNSPNMTVSDASHIDAVVPNGLAGTVDVVVSNRWGLQSSPGIPVTIT
jgi:hypothetical protein